MFALIKNQIVEAFPLSFVDVRNMFPNTSFTDTTEVDGDPENGIYPVSPVEKPECSYRQNADGNFCENIDGKWIQVWKITDATPEQIAERIESQWLSVVQDRNSRLAASDWTLLFDSPIHDDKKPEWITYRQALRDVTDQSDPFNIVWPPLPK
jgi:Phage tail assembly chaperone protein